MLEAGFTYVGKKIELNRKVLSPIFSDPFYAGTYKYGKIRVELRDVYPQSHPYKPMITRDEFLRLRSILRNGQPNFNKKTNKKSLPYKNLITCGSCNSTMTPEVTTGNTTRTFRVSCKNNKCSGSTLKLSRSIRSYELTDYIGDLLLKGVGVSKQGYEDYVSEMNRDLATKIEQQRNKYRLLLTNIKLRKKTLDELVEKSLPKAKTGVVLDKVNKQIEKVTDEVQELKKESEGLQESINDAEYALKHQVMSYETFSNYIKNIGHTIKTSDNLAEIGKIAEMVFSNLVIEDGKVLSYSINPNFERYLKPSCLLLSGRQDSNLRPHAPKARALPTAPLPVI